MEIVPNNDELRNNAGALMVIYNELMARRNAATNRDEWMKHDHDAKKAWNAWRKAMEMLTMRSDSGSYSPEQGGTYGK